MISLASMAYYDTPTPYRAPNREGKGAAPSRPLQKSGVPAGPYN
jgi:hypothetical protein